MSKWDGIESVGHGTTLTGQGPGRGVMFDPGPLPPHPNHGKVTVQVIKETTAKPEKVTTSAATLTRLASDWLRAQYPNALIIQEFSVQSYGTSMMDLAAITENEIIGVEIKGDADSPARLPLQGWSYSKTATKIYLFCSEDKEAKYNGHRPRGWGQLKVRNGVVSVGTKPGILDNAPRQLVQCLWQGEKTKIAKEHGVLGPKGAPVWSEIHERLALSVLRPAVCKALHERNWSKIVGYRHGRFRFPGE